jgi:hypothetical protein
MKVCYICDGLFPTYCIECVDYGKQLNEMYLSWCYSKCSLEELRGGGNLTNLTQDGWCPGRNSKWGISDLLTYSMVQSPSWAADWLAASQEIPRISRNPKVHYLTHKRPPPVSILGQLSPVHIPTSHLLEIHPNIIHPSTPRSPHWSPSLRFPHQDPIPPRASLTTSQKCYLSNWLSPCNCK